jgi:hypothetical protein
MSETPKQNLKNCEKNPYTKDNDGDANQDLQEDVHYFTAGFLPLTFIVGVPYRTQLELP